MAATNPWRFAAHSLLAVLIVTVFGVLARGQEDDTEPPEIVGLIFSPSSLDLSSGSQALTVTAEITDNLSGVDFVRVELQSPSLVQWQHVYRVGS